MAFGFHVGPDGFDFSRGIDQHRATGNPLIGFAHKPLHAPGAVRFDHFVVGIAEQGEIEFQLGAKALQ